MKENSKHSRFNRKITSLKFCYLDLRSISRNQTAQRHIYCKDTYEGRIDNNRCESNNQATPSATLRESRTVVDIELTGNRGYYKCGASLSHYLQDIFLDGSENVSRETSKPVIHRRFGLRQPRDYDRSRQSCFFHYTHR